MNTRSAKTRNALIARRKNAIRQTYPYPTGSKPLLAIIEKDYGGSIERYIAELVKQ